MNKITKYALVFSLLGAPLVSLATERLVVWEDVKKSTGIMDAVADFENQYDCKVEVKELQFVDQIEQLRVSGPKGSGPDVLMIPSDKIGMAVRDDLVVPIPFMVEDQEKYIQSSVSAFKFGSNYYAVPKVVETLVMFYNKKLLKRPFDTLDEYYEYSKKQVFLSGDGNNYGLLAKWDNFYYAFGVMSSYNSYVFASDLDGNYKVNDIGLNNEGAITALELIRKFYTSKCFPRSIVGYNGVTQIDSYFTDGKAAAVINGPWAIEPYQKSGVDYGVTPLPILPNGKSMGSFLGVKGYVISKWSANKELAEKFLKFINKPQYVRLRFIKTQEIPALKEVLMDPVITDNDFANAIAVQASRATPMPSIAQMADVWAPIDMALNSIVLEKKSIESALNEAVEKITYQIKQSSHEKKR